jgi:hypothetical protein
VGRGAEEGAAAEKPFSTIEPTRWDGDATVAAVAAAEVEAGGGGSGSKGPSTTLRRAGWAPRCRWCFCLVASSIDGLLSGALPAGSRQRRV